MDKTVKFGFDTLIQCLHLVASDADEQISVFPDFVVIPDEIALEYDDALIWLDDYYSEKLITMEQMSRLKEIDDLFTRMSDDKSQNYWDLEALRNALEWDRARVIAGELLQSLGIKKDHPNLYWVTYVPGKTNK